MIWALVALALSGSRPNSPVYNPVRAITAALATPPRGTTYLDILPGTPTPGVTLTNRGVPVADSRNSVATYIDGGGLMVTASANQPRVEAAGFLVEEGSRNERTYSSSTPLWTNFTGTPTSTVTNDPLCPIGVDGTTHMASITYANPSGKIQPGGTPGLQPYELSGFFATFAGDAACNQQLKAVGSGQIDCALMALSQTPTRFTCHTTLDDRGVTLQYPSTGTTCTRVCVEYAQTEATTRTYPTSPMLSGATPTQRLADDAPIVLSATPNPASAWYLTVTATPENGRAWGTTNYSVSVGTNAAANSLAQIGNTLVVYDAAANARILTASAPTSAEHRLTACGGAFPVRWYIAGVEVTSASGTGTGIMSAFPSTVYLGEKSDATLQFDGNLKNIKLATGCVP